VEEIHRVAMSTPLCAMNSTNTIIQTHTIASPHLAGHVQGLPQVFLRSRRRVVWDLFGRHSWLWDERATQGHGSCTGEVFECFGRGGGSYYARNVVARGEGLKDKCADT